MFDPNVMLKTAILRLTTHGFAFRVDIPHWGSRTIRDLLCCPSPMESRPNTPAPYAIPGYPIGFLSNGDVERYLLEAESTTGFVAWKLADGTILVSESTAVSLKSSPSLMFWPCAAYRDTTPAGRIRRFYCHGNSLTHLDVRALSGLEYLDCSFNQLTALDLHGLIDLEALDVENNNLTNLEVRHLRNLRLLNCASNFLKNLDLSGMDTLEVLEKDNNPLHSIKIDGCTSLRDFGT